MCAKKICIEVIKKMALIIKVYIDTKIDDEKTKVVV